MDLAVDGREALRVVPWVRVAAHRPPELPIGAEFQRVAWPEGALHLVPFDEDLLAGQAGCPIHHREPRYLGRVGRRRIRDVDESVATVVAREARIEDQAEQASLAGAVGLE